MPDRLVRLYFSAVFSRILGVVRWARIGVGRSFLEGLCGFEVVWAEIPSEPRVLGFSAR